MLPRRAPFRRFLALLAAAASLHGAGRALVPPLHAQGAQDTAAAPDTSAGAGAAAPALRSAADTAAGDTAATASPGGRAGMPLWVSIVFLGIAGATAAALWLGRTTLQATARALVYAVAAVSLLAAGLAGGLWWAGGAPAARAGPGAGWGLLQLLLLGLAAVSLVFLAMFVMETRRHAVALESHWGGFGGGLGGLRVPAAGLYLLAALGFGTMLTVLSVQHLEALATAEAKDADAGKQRAAQADTPSRPPAARPAAAAPDSAAAAADTSQP
ncbi:MAG TPA: hypothetical protein VF746_27665 [Longimicrobium sp.]